MATQKDSSCYLLLGSDEGEKKVFIESLFPPPETPREVLHLHPGEEAFGARLVDLAHERLFPTYRVVYLHDADQIKEARNGDMAILLRYLGTPAKATLLLIISEKVKVAPSLERAILSGKKKIFWEMFVSERKRWIVTFFQKKKMGIKPQAAEMLLQLVENDTEAMRETCERLAHHFGSSHLIDEANVENLIYHGKSENVFSLFERVAVRDLPRALIVLETILYAQEAEAPQIVAGMLWQYRELLALKERVVQEKITEEEACHKGIRGKRRQEIYRRAMAHFSSEEVKKIIVLSQYFDRAFRTTKKEMHRHLLHLYFYQVLRAPCVSPLVPSML